MSEDAYVEALLAKLKDLQDEAASLKIQVQELFGEIEKREEQARHIAELLRAEGVDPSTQGQFDLGQIPLVDTAYRFLSESKHKTPMHYTDLSTEIIAHGIPIPGKEPAANLLTHITRDERFIRVSPGTYGLKDWGLVANPAKRGRRRRKRKRRA